MNEEQVLEIIYHLEQIAGNLGDLVELLTQGLKELKEED